ncbi:MAG: PH domain-containing protein [Candidatus Nanohalobium sp.]
MSRRTWTRCKNVMKLSKASILYRALKRATVLFGVFFFTQDLPANLSENIFSPGFLGIVIAFSSLSVIFFLVWEYLVWKRFDYFFEEDSLKITKGVFRRSERDIPYKRIQNVRIRKNIFQRLLEIARAEFETAGAAEAEASLKYVSMEESEQIQSKVRKFKKSEKEETSSKEKVFEMSGSDMAAYSFLSLNPRFFGILAVFLTLTGSIGFTSGLPSASFILGLLMFSTVLAAVLWCVNAAYNYVQYYGFTLWRENETLEYEYGMINRSEGSIPLEKVQGLTVSENFLKRVFGYSTLEIETAGGVSKEDKKKIQKKVAVPLAKKTEVEEFGKRIENFEGLQISGIPSRARRRYFARYSIGILTLTGLGLAASFYTDFSYWWSFLGLLPVATAAAHFKWKNKGFQVQGNHFITMNGFWNRKTSITPYYRIQNLIQSETVLQKRWKLSTLILDTASSSIVQDSKAVDLDTEKAEKTREKVFEKFKASIQN